MVIKVVRALRALQAYIEGHTLSLETIVWEGLLYLTSRSETKQGNQACPFATGVAEDRSIPYRTKDPSSSKAQNL